VSLPFLSITAKQQRVHCQDRVFSHFTAKDLLFVLFCAVKNLMRYRQGREEREERLRKAKAKISMIGKRARNAHWVFYG